VGGTGKGVEGRTRKRTKRKDKKLEIRKKRISSNKLQGWTGFLQEVEALKAQWDTSAFIHLKGVEGIARSFVSSGLCGFADTPVLIICPDPSTRERVARELESLKCLMGDALPLLKEKRILQFPAWELTPYLDEWIHPRVASSRIKVLLSLLERRPTVILSTPEALAIKLVKPNHLRQSLLTLQKGEVLGNREEFLALLSARGYEHAVSTELPGDVSVRGGIIDLFSPTEDSPVRIELEGDEIATLRLFDPTTQRTIRHIDSYTISSVQELFPQRPLQDIRKHLYGLETSKEGKREIHRLLQALSTGENIENAIWLTPFLYDLQSDIYSYLPPATPILWWDPEEGLNRLAKFLDTARHRFEKRRESLPILPGPDTLFLRPETLSKRMEIFPLITFGLHVAMTKEVKTNDRFEGKPFSIETAKRHQPKHWPVSLIAEETARLKTHGFEVWIAEPSEKQREELRKKLIAFDQFLPVFASLPSPDKSGAPGILTMDIPQGFVFPQLKLAVLSRLRPWVPRQKATPKSSSDSIDITEIATFKEGDPLVHLDYGIGLYRGLKPMEVLGKQGEFLVMEYAKGDKLFVPIDKLDLVQRYVGTRETPPPLDTLGTTSWERKKRRLREDVAKMAKELLNLYATRKAVKGHAFHATTEGLEEFEASFPYQETPDQKRAIEDIYRDMASETPMDRLICGDVGFGKTEVAMRAAFKAVMEGKQVAVLVPTTVLAEQHHVNFSQRFAPYPVRVELLSRFRSRHIQKGIVSDLKKGKVDIVIGTHRLLQKDIAFRDLGLLIVDEEHRFGVTHKELLKKLSATVDVLTLTATPIPRTLQMSLSGLRDLSLINTPPRTRRPILTKIVRFRKDIITEGIERELARGGQVFFVHNRVKTISKMAKLIQGLVPSARVTYAHGQMDEKELEEVMLAFMHHEIDVLVCTTIIESGVDIPNVNTLFVHHAEQFGLSTLYQLRGRIGRSDRQAFAYFLIPHRAILPKEAIKRLQSLQEFSSLGSGFKLSMMDLNIRGGGDLLGRKQSGRIAELGFDLYLKIIEEEVKKIKGEWKEPPPPLDLKLPFPLFIPDSYIPDMGIRLTFYRRLSTLKTEGEIRDIREEMEDRFGSLPPDAQHLLDTVRLKMWLSEHGVITLHGKENEIIVGFSEESSVDRQHLISLLQTNPAQFKLSPSQKLIIRGKMPKDFSSYLTKLYSVLKQLMGYDRNAEEKR